MNNSAFYSTRKEALMAGALMYFTGRPCPSGHVSLRYAQSSHCRECLRTKNKADVEGRQRRENRRKGTRKQEWYIHHQDEMRAHWKRWSSENDRTNYHKEYRKKNPDKINANTRNRKARIRAAEGKHTGQDVEKIRLEQSDRCNYCCVDLGGRGHVDHKTPLSRGGSNWPSNLQLLCPACNIRKFTLTHEEYVACHLEKVAS